MLKNNKLITIFVFLRYILIIMKVNKRSLSDCDIKCEWYFCTMCDTTGKINCKKKIINYK